jgi:hypothetical protein
MQRNSLLITTAIAGLLVLSGTAVAQDASGQAAALRANTNGGSSALADTGTLEGLDDARGAGTLQGGIAGSGNKGRFNGTLGEGIALHAATVGGNGDSQSVFSEASVGNFSFDFGNNSIAADFVMTIVSVDSQAGVTTHTVIHGLTIDGSPIEVTGEPNQTIRLRGGRLVVNEQIGSGRDTIVNGMRIIINGNDDVTVASARAGL